MSHRLQLQFERHSQWRTVLQVCQNLTESGFKTYLVGGCVRDALLKRSISDFDVATEAHPEHILELFPNSLDVGKSFGIMMIPYGEFQIEVATFRKEGEYIDGRRPERVEFASIEEDALRRDFTVNALYYDPINKKLVDIVGGIDDINHSRLQTVGEPQRRFAEDHLRLLRAIRFAGQLNYTLEKETAKSVKNLASFVRSVSKERVVQELEKLFTSQHCLHGWHLVFLLDLWKPLFALEINVRSRVLIKTFFNMHSTESSIKRTGWVMISWVLFHEEIQKGAEGQQRFEDWLQCWKFSKQKNRNIIFVVKTLSRWNELPVFDKLKFLDHEWAAEGVMILTFLKQWENQNLGDLQEIIAHFLEVSVGLGHLPHPFVRASDLIAQGEPPGPQLGEKLEAYYQLQITHKIQSKEELLRLININTL